MSAETITGQIQIGSFAVNEFAEVAVLVLFSIAGGLGCTVWLGAAL
ncbi:MAG: hypothetical protein J7K94_02945 [Dehalococcoidia bacterium]|nr:hypothetical protein [Dehalococcoidia bacterium]